MKSIMKSVIKRTTVQGTPYEVWIDYIMRATFAKSEISGDRKAIAVKFGHSKFSR